MTDVMTIEEAENRDATIGKFSVTGYECVKSDRANLTVNTQQDVLEKIVRGADDEKIVERVHEAATSIRTEGVDWDLIGIPQGLGQRIDPENPGQDNTYGWSQSGNHPRGEAPRAAWFANHLLDGIEFSEGDKPKRVPVKTTHTVRGEPVDVLAFESGTDLSGIDIKLDVQEAQRKTLEDPMEAILEAVGVEPVAAFQGRTQSQSSLSNFV